MKKKNRTIKGITIYAIIWVLIFGVWMFCNSYNINYDQCIDLDAILMVTLLIGGVILLTEEPKENDSKEEES